MRQRLLSVMGYIHARPRWMKMLAWILHDTYFSYSAFNQVTGLEEEAVLYSALVMALTVACGLYPKLSVSFTAKTYGTIMACSLLAVIAEQALITFTAAPPLTPGQAWAIVLYMLPVVANRYNVNTTFNIVIPDMKLPPEQRMHAKRKAR